MPVERFPGADSLRCPYPHCEQPPDSIYRFYTPAGYQFRYYCREHWSHVAANERHWLWSFHNQAVGTAQRRSVELQRHRAAMGGWETVLRQPMTTLPPRQPVAR